MGQYHIPVNISRKEFINPHSLASGLKQLEQADLYFAEKGKESTWAVVPIALYAGLSTSIERGGGDFDDHAWLGRWAGGIVIVAGDYGERGDIAARSGTGEGNDDCDLYYHCCALDDESWASTLEWTDEQDPTGDKRRRYERLGRFTDVTPLVWDWMLKEYGITFEGDGWTKIEFVGRPS